MDDDSREVDYTVLNPPSNSQSRLIRPPTGRGRARSELMSSTVHRQNQLRDTLRSVSDWASASSRSLLNSDEGLMDELVFLNSTYFHEISQAVKRHQGATPAAQVPEVLEALEARKKFNLLKAD